MPEYLRLDMFPATVTRGDGSIIDPVRAVVTEDTLYVFEDANPTPQAVIIAPLYDFESKSRTRYIATTDDEQEQIVIAKRAGCGCGNKLKGFRAFPGVPLKKL
jgi:hypothetical protein